MMMQAVATHVQASACASAAPLFGAHNKSSLSGFHAPRPDDLLASIPGHLAPASMILLFIGTSSCRTFAQCQIVNGFYQSYGCGSSDQWPVDSSLTLQVPPAIPTLLMCWLACLWHGATFMIDWHNFAHTLMSLSMTHKHPLVCKSNLRHIFQKLNSFA